MVNTSFAMALAIHESIIESIITLEYIIEHHKVFIEDILSPLTDTHSSRGLGCHCDSFTVLEMKLRLSMHHDN